MDVKLFVWSDGSLDLHAQTGQGHDYAVAQAAEILKARGLKVGKWDGSMYPSGIYYQVTRQ